MIHVVRLAQSSLDVISKRVRRYYWIYGSTRFNFSPSIKKYFNMFEVNSDAHSSIAVSTNTLHHIL